MARFGLAGDDRVISRLSLIMVEPTRVRKIAVVGSRAVGKSTMIVRFVEEHFVESYYPTIENQFNKTIKIRGQEYNVEILDTAGQDEYSIINQKHLIGVDGFILAYSVTNRSTFDMVSIIYDKILNYSGADSVPAVIVGNKSDLELQRQVSEEDGKALAAELNAGFTETSARLNENIGRAFELLIMAIEKRNNPSKSGEDKGCVIS